MENFNPEQWHNTFLNKSQTMGLKGLIPFGVGTGLGAGAGAGLAALFSKLTRNPIDDLITPAMTGALIGGLPTGVISVAKTNRERKQALQEDFDKLPYDQQVQVLNYFTTQKLKDPRFTLLG